MQTAHATTARQGARVNVWPRNALGQQARNRPPTREVVTTGNPALMAPIGRVNLNALNSHDWKRQLSDFIHQYGRRRSNDFTRQASEETLRNRHDILFSTVRDLMVQDKNLRSLSQIKPRLLPKMFELWDQKGISKRAQINYFNQMRWFWRVCGIEVEPISHYAKYEGEFTINRNAERDKSWSGNGVDFDQVYKQMEAIDPVGARLMLAMKTYGLRLKESLCLKPHESDAGDAMYLSRGTKTGKPRAINFDDFGEEALRSVLGELKDKIDPESHLAWQNRSLKQAKSRMQYLARKVGLTKDQLGVTWHGLRHEFAIDQLQKLTGVEAPVRGGVVLNYRELSAARKKVSEALGHHRVKITGAYYGSFLSLERDQLRKFDASWQRIESAMQKVGKLLSIMEIDNLYWTGLHAAGAGNMTTGYEFVLPPGVGADICTHVCKEIADMVVSTTGYDCTVVPWESLPALKQQVCEVTAVPIFAAVGPWEYMKDQVLQQRQVREMLKRSRS